MSGIDIARSKFPLWRLDDLQATSATANTPRRCRSGGESLTRGEVVLAYVGPDGELVKTVRRAAMFPVRSEHVRTRADGDDVVVSFPVRGTAGGMTFEAEAEWFRADATGYERASEGERKRAVEKANPAPQVRLVGRIVPYTVDEVKTTSGTDKPVTLEKRRYGNPPDTFPLTAYDSDGNRIGCKTGTRYRPQDGLPEYDQ